MRRAGHGTVELMLFVMRPWPAPSGNDNAVRIVVLSGRTQ